MRRFINTSKVDQKLVNSVGIALKANKVFVGEKLQELMHKGKINLIVVATDASESFIKTISDNIMVVTYLDQERLASLINRYGKKINGFGITDKNLSRLILNQFNAMEGECQ